MPQVSFHILGGYEADVLHWRTKTAGLNNIAFYGFRPQREVSAFLFHLRHRADAAYQKTVESRGTDKDSSHWLTPEEFEKRLDEK